jgi:hypothetical protein
MRRGHQSSHARAACFEAICVGHIIRYLWRYRVKHPQNPLVDVKKSVYYLNRLIAEIESQERK